jgi:hypothetical protein
MIRETIAHVKRRWNYEYEKIFQLVEELKNCDQLIDENQFVGTLVRR